ncbi:MAG: FeS-binding protein [Anaerolineae bacterium]|nr:FeS-binding protein [Anaerolineae bacterium]
MTQELFSRLEARGYQGRIVSIQHLAELQEELETHYRQGLLDQELYRTYLAGFAFEPPESLPDARSLIVVAVPQPQVRITFAWQRRRVPLIVPPTYLHWRENDQQVEDLLTEVLGSLGYRVSPMSLPKKLLAVHSGLAAYGRNNISYVPGMGSFHRLVAFCSDFPCQEDNWQALRMMVDCQDCSACRRHCPTGAIVSERFLLDAERCITFHNENPHEFPDWLDSAGHDCLVGCLHCQRVCPQNREVWHWIEEGGEFSSQETALLLAGPAIERLPAETVKKLAQNDLVGLLDVLPRNLRAALRSRSM